MTGTNDLALESVARLFARLMLHELDEELRAELAAPAVAEVLAELGIDPANLGPDTDLDELAVQFLEAFVQPEVGGPPVQSLWTEGSYEGDCAVAIRKLADAAGVDFDRDAARGAPHDHLASILLLWSAVRADRDDIAQRIEEQHLTWSLAPLSRVAAGEGFYAELARAVAALVGEIAGPEIRNQVKNRRRRGGGF